MPVLTLPIPSLSIKQISRFRGYVAKKGPDECWLWTKATWGSGYGCFRIGKILKGELRSNETIHLESEEKNRAGLRFGEDNRSCRIPSDRLPELFELARSGLSQRKIAKRFGVKQCSVWNILKGNIRGRETVLLRAEIEE